MYGDILERFPGSAEARAARVPLAQLLLERTGDPAGALRVFDEYLSAAREGPLVEEAAWGRARALGRLGHGAEEADALRAFPAAHPWSLHAGEARRRLAELGDAGSGGGP